MNLSPSAFVSRRGFMPSLWKRSRRLVVYGFIVILGWKAQLVAWPINAWGDLIKIFEILFGLLRFPREATNWGGSNELVAVIDLF